MSEDAPKSVADRWKLNKGGSGGRDSPEEEDPSTWTRWEDVPAVLQEDVWVHMLEGRARRDEEQTQAYVWGLDAWARDAEARKKSIELALRRLGFDITKTKDGL